MGTSPDDPTRRISFGEVCSCHERGAREAQLSSPAWHRTNLVNRGGREEHGFQLYAGLVHVSRLPYRTSLSHHSWPSLISIDESEVSLSLSVACISCGQMMCMSVAA